MMAVAVAFIMAWREGAVEDGPGEDRAHGLLAGFRSELCWCLGKRPDALFELADAVLCKQDRVHMLAELSLEPECRRGHGAVYDALNAGQVQVARLQRALAALALPAWDDGRIRLAVDVSNWLRPDAATSPERLFCHCYARGKGNAQLIPGWPYSLVVALEPGRTSWTLPLDAVRLGPAQARGPGDLARPGGEHCHRDEQIRHRPGRGLGPAAPAAGQPRRVGGPPRRAAGHRGHPHPAAGTAPARRPLPGTALAVVITRRNLRR